MYGNTNLLPCPCCGADAALVEYFYEGQSKTKGFMVRCPDCQLETNDVAEGFMNDGDLEWKITAAQAKNIVASRWNRRDTPADRTARLTPKATQNPGNKNEADWLGKTMHYAGILRCIANGLHYAVCGLKVCPDAGDDNISKFNVVESLTEYLPLLAESLSRALHRLELGGEAKDGQD